MSLAGRGLLGLVLVFLYAPIAVMVVMAFDDSTLGTLPFRPTLHWFTDFGADDKLLAATRNSLGVAVATSAIATGLGTMAALALGRHRFRGRTLLQILLLPPIAIPWLITGTAMLLFFFWTGIGRGLHAMILGHVALALPYAVLVIGTGLQSLAPELEEAATSLGATPAMAFRTVTLPLLGPSLAAAALFCFAVSLDQFVVSYFLATPGVSTLPVEIYTAIRKGFTPEINAVSTLLLAASVTLFGAFAALTRMGGADARR